MIEKYSVSFCKFSAVPERMLCCKHSVDISVKLKINGVY